MTGVQFLTDADGNRKSVLIDWEMYGDSLQDFLEYLEDLNAFEKVKDEEIIPFEGVIAHLLEQKMVTREQVELFKKQ